MESGAAYRMIFGNRYTFDALRGLTVAVKGTAHVAVWKSQTLRYTTKRLKRQTPE